MKGIIIAGGFGTRLRPLTYQRPKHLLLVANRPFLEYQVALLRESGVTDIIFATNYYADKIESHFQDGSAFGVRMQYALEDEPLGTAGAIRNAANLAGGESVIVFNGDVLTDFDIGSIIAFHQQKQAKATIALRAIPRPHAFGALATEPDGRVLSWTEPSEDEKKRVAENPGPPTGESDFINAGIYVLEPEIVERIPTGSPVSIERETYPALLSEGVPVYGIAPEGYWMDIGRPEQYLAANTAVLTHAVKTVVPFQQIGDGAEIAEDAQIDATTSVGKGAKIGSGTRLTGCILLDGVTVGAKANLNVVIADERAAIADDVTARGGQVIASDSRIERGTRL